MNIDFNTFFNQGWRVFGSRCTEKTETVDDLFEILIKSTDDKYIIEHAIPEYISYFSTPKRVQRLIQIIAEHNVHMNSSILANIWRILKDDQKTVIAFNEWNAAFNYKRVDYTFIDLLHKYIKNIICPCSINKNINIRYCTF